MIFNLMKEIYNLKKEISNQYKRIVELEDENKAFKGVIDFQEKEIERLRERANLDRARIFNDTEYTKSLEKATKTLEAKLNHAQKEALKEFTESFKKKAIKDKSPMFRIPYYQMSVETFNNFVKEMEAKT